MILLRRWPYPIPKTLPLHNLNKARVPSGSQWPGVDFHQTRLDSWEASSMTCYTSLAIIARDLMSDQVPSASPVCRILSELHRLECHDSWRNRNVSFLTCDGWWRIAMLYWSAFLKIEGKQNSPTVIVPISKESSSHQPRKSKILQVFQKLQWSSFRTHHIIAITWLPVVLNWSESELSKGCFNLQGLDGRIFGGTPLSGQNTMLVLHCGNG